MQLCALPLHLPTNIRMCAHKHTAQSTTHIHYHNTPEVTLCRTTPSALLSIEATKCQHLLVSDVIICHKNPWCPFEALVKAVKLLSPINQEEYHNIVY